MYGGYLYSGLSGVAGERYAADALRTPPDFPVTQTSQGGTLRALYGGMPKMRTLVYGETPVEEIEGHQVDPFYDVRGGGLGQVPVMNRGKRVGGRALTVPWREKWQRGKERTERGLANRPQVFQASATESVSAPAIKDVADVAVPGIGVGIPTQYLVYGGLALVVLMLKKKRR